jgi:hypothetical protein
MAAAAQPAQRPALRARVDKLIELYDGAYMSDPVLTQIARNVLTDARSLLR